MAVDARDIDMATTLASELDERDGVELSGKRRIYGDAPPSLQMEMAIDVAGDELGSAGALGGRHTSTLGAESFP
jgi:hypothetical protein